jgi:hypothetical protein
MLETTMLLLFSRECCSSGTMSDGSGLSEHAGIGALCIHTTTEVHYVRFEEIFKKPSK